MKLVKSIRLKVLPELYSISRLDSKDPIPAWADGDGFVSIARSADELSIVCHQSRVPEGIKSDRDWSCIQLVGPFAFDETGIVLSVVRPLTEACFGVFVVSTFDGDFLLLKTDQFAEGLAVLREAGHQILD
ncbi:ACT domain-containing protein [Pseudomonas sp. CCM 7891]|uniref:ACT domain-containing protein n=1 Tax=Pseudomonas karstica TaxID=1055468 RepID=A0A7X2UYP9_9PSED|nr:ACT domain-containing protein [Pseudomonas karstica]MTD19332.1 ACT domain-containing protein [Pseudomonas karstica]